MAIYDFELTEMSGQRIKLSSYQGKVILIVNTASKCGFAPQLEELEMLYQQYHGLGLEIIGIPSNQFHQELATNEETNDYCRLYFGVTFPMTQQVRVNGADADPLFVYLKKVSGKGPIKWNFTKFLIDREGKLFKRYAPMTRPKSFETTIQELLTDQKNAV